VPEEEEEEEEEENIRTKIHRTVILLIVLYGCETWSLKLRREHRLSVERKISGPKADEVTEEWRRLHKEELVELHSLLNIIRGISSRRLRCPGHVECMGRGEVHIGFCGKNEMERNHLEGLEVDTVIILKWIFNK
jgi:hypothetical protein